MITEIKAIHGIGRYDKFDSTVALKKNQIIFGFNGTGKSTLSDIFYSVSEQKGDLLNERRTLPAEDGTEASEILVSLGTDDGELTFKDGKWDSKDDVHVFNDHYIDEYVFIENNHSFQNATVIFGKDGARLAQKKQRLQQDIENNLNNINQVIIARKELCGNLGIGKTRLKISGSEKKIKQISEIKLYLPSQYAENKNKLAEHTAYDERIQKIKKWKASLSCGDRYLNTEQIEIVKHIKKILYEIPKVTNKEIADHISRYMSHVDVNWLATGTHYQSDISVCPFCGQKIVEGSYKKMVTQLNRFISGKQKQKADEIAKRIRSILPYFDGNKLEHLFKALEVIKEENGETKLLKRSTTALLDCLQMSPSNTTNDFISTENKLVAKAMNPYEAITLSPEEESVCKVILLVLNKLSKLSIALDNEVSSYESKNRKAIEYVKCKALFDASFGEARESMEMLVASAKSIGKLLEDIQECQRKIDELFETKKLGEINNFLQELNVNFRVGLVDRKYCIQIIGYKATEYTKNNKILCSEGERRILSLAYFLQEIEATQEKKVIVIDDPISSLDLSRKSVVSYKVAELMSKSENQIIILSHDISFIEKIKSVVPSDLDIGLLELTKEKSMPFKDLLLNDYLITDEEVYEKMIKIGEETNDINKKIIALMALRPLTYIKCDMDAKNPKYQDIEKRSTHLAHSIYSKSSRVPYRANKYNKRSLRAYCKKVAKITKVDVDSEKLVPENWNFRGFDYNNTWEIYNSISGNDIGNLRMKALILRLVLETSLFMLVSKKAFNPERIGFEYTKAVKNTKDDRHVMCLELDRLYDLSKKYHHGADNGSTLGLSALNPDEMIYYDKQIQIVHNWIETHTDQCNPNATDYS